MLTVKQMQILKDVLEYFSDKKLEAQKLFQVFVNYIMAESKYWSQEQDRMLKALYQQDSPPKWTVIATQINKNFEHSHKTGKQCQERYHNTLAPFISKHPWTKDEERKMFALHDQLGNKWSDIAKQLPGRAHNCVKNRFYGEMRKTLRRLNAYHLERVEKKSRPVNVDTMIKIISIGHRNHQENKKLGHLKQECIILKNKILFYGMQDQFEIDDGTLIKDIYQEVRKMGIKLKHHSICRATGTSKKQKGKLATTTRKKNRSLSKQVNSKSGTSEMKEMKLSHTKKEQFSDENEEKNFYELIQGQDQILEENEEDLKDGDQIKIQDIKAEQDDIPKQQQLSRKREDIEVKSEENKPFVEGNNEKQIEKQKKKYNYCQQYHQFYQQKYHPNYNMNYPHADEQKPQLSYQVGHQLGPEYAQYHWGGEMPPNASHGNEGLKYQHPTGTQYPSYSQYPAYSDYPYYAYHNANYPPPPPSYPYQYPSSYYYPAEAYHPESMQKPPNPPKEQED